MCFILFIIIVATAKLSDFKPNTCTDFTDNCTYLTDSRASLKLCTAFTLYLLANRGIHLLRSNLDDIATSPQSGKAEEFGN